MSIDSKFGRYCDECGDTISKAHRIYLQRDYCTKCYVRIFVPKSCSTCGKSTRVHRLETTPPVCRQCTNQGRVCIRCEKMFTKAGLISDGKPVCPSCVPFFRTPNPCGACGKMSTRLSAMPSLGINDKVCDSCRYKVTHRTCSVCRRYRKVAGNTDAGASYCIACVPGSESAHNCPQCGVRIPGNGNGKCIGCLNSIRLEKEAMLLASSLSHDWAKSLCIGFANWLWQRHKQAPNLCAKYRTNHLIIQQLDATFVEVADISSKALLSNFGTAAIRRHLLLFKYLQEALGFHISQQEKSDASDAQRIHQNLLDNRSQPWASILIGYVSWLEDQKVLLRTRRLYLSTVVSFCQAVKIKTAFWDEKNAYKFLRTNPGCEANTSKFVTYCRDVLGWRVAMPRVNHGKTVAKPPRTVSRLKLLLARVKENGIEQTDQNTLRSILAISLGIKSSALKEIDGSSFMRINTSLFLRVGDESIKIPDSLDQISEAYMKSLSHKDPRASSLDEHETSSN